MDNSSGSRGRRRIGGVVAVYLALAASMVLAASPASAQVFEVLGTRALGMGGAFVAVADDATAAYWNPAGLPTGALFSLLVDSNSSTQWLTRAQPDTPAADQTATIVALSSPSVAVAYYRLRINQIERPPPVQASPDPTRIEQRGEAILRSAVTHHLALTGAQLLSPGVSLGTTVRFVRGVVGVSQVDPMGATDELLQRADELTRSGSHDVDFDVGLMIGSDAVRVGVVAKNLLRPSFDTPDGGVVQIDRHIRTGVGIRVVGGVLVSADVDLSRAETVTGEQRNLAVGAEHWLQSWLGVRAGVRFDLEDDNPHAVGAVGLSLALTSGVYLDAQVTRGRDSVERGWGIAGRVGF